MVAGVAITADFASAASNSFGRAGETGAAPSME
jgi:hypothetical protein